jgi:hypothetical protein
MASPSSLRPASGEIGARAAVTQALRLLAKLGYRLNGRDAGVCLVEAAERRVWRVELGPPLGAAFSLDVDSRSGVVVYFEDNAWQYGIGFKGGRAQPLRDELDLRRVASSLMSVFRLPQGSTIAKIDREARGVTLAGGRYVSPLSAVRCAGPAYKYPVTGTDNAAKAIIERSTGRLVRFSSDFPGAPRRSVIRLTADQAIAKAKAVPAPYLPVEPSKPRLVYARPNRNLGPLLPSLARDGRLVLCWEVRFRFHVVWIDAESGASCGGETLEKKS